MPYRQSGLARAAGGARSMLMSSSAGAAVLAILWTGIPLVAAAESRAIESVHGRKAAAGEALVRYKLPPRRGRQLTSASDVDRDTPIGAGWRLVHSKSRSAAALVASLQASGDIDAVEPNYQVRLDGIPNDFTPALWALENTGQAIGNGDFGTPGADISGPAAWDRTTGSRDAVVAVIDSGVMAGHVDLAANLWSAPRAYTVTIGGVSVSCAAGTHGFNVLTKTCDPGDDNGHGTHIAGTIGALGGNGTGTVGVNWTASIMAVKFLDSAGNGFVSDAIDAIEFAVQAKEALGAAANVRVLNNSWNGGDYSQALADEIARANAADMLFVASAGNDSGNIDATPVYPASYAAPNVVAVAASDYRDELASFSNYGPSSVHLAAPGVFIYSTYVSPSDPSVSDYTTLSGTSMGAAYVSGAAALVLSHCSYSTASLRDALLAWATPLAALSDRVEGGRRLNVAAAVASCDASGAGSSSAGPLSPYGGAAWALPGTIRAENFDNGGEGVAYHDSSAGNSGGAYRATDVDVETSSEGAYDVGWTTPGEWLNYTVNVASSGDYGIALRVASPSGAALHVGFNGPSAGAWKAVTVAPTGGWQNWTIVTVPVTLGAGTQQMTVMFDTGGVNFAAATVSGSATSSGDAGPYGGTPAAVPGTVPAANFDEGGEGVSYHDTTPGNTGGAGGRATDVDIEPSSEGGYDVGWTVPGEWLNYTVAVANAGSYVAALRVASPEGGALHIGFNGPSNVWTTVTVPPTGGWQDWTTVDVPVTLGAGRQQMTLLFDTGALNISYIVVRE